MNEKEFYDKIDEWISADISSWTHITLLAYFCYKYEKKNGVRFRLVRSRKGPTMGKEAADFAKLFRMLAPENYKNLDKEEKRQIRTNLNLKIKNYINWMFDYKFRRGQQSVNGTRLFLVSSIIVEFERMYESYLENTKREKTIKDLLSWCKLEIPDILDRHQLESKSDIEMISKYADMYSLDNNSQERKLIVKARELRLI